MVDKKGLKIKLDDLSEKELIDKTEEAMEDFEESFFD